MPDWQRVAPVAEFPPGTRRVVELDGVRVIIFNLDGGYHAIEDLCSHDGGELASGRLEGCDIVCPRHGARFDIRTGAVAAPPAYEAIASLPTRISEGWLEVRDDRWDRASG
ncbi:MAG: non-heme iron oxygenase ferredoxin subunit [Gallionellaceae bacterium]|nr:non-heme iron oxygenase ferredoxin subunit [Gallionellaceae bacterium]MDD5367185.1 non-heme iron oxygenase ferredoxin subunit [Gallionellaceae bacterium]